MIAMTTLMALNPNIQAIAKAQVVGKKVFDVIEREPKIKDHKDALHDFNI